MPTITNSLPCLALHRIHRLVVQTHSHPHLPSAATYFAVHTRCLHYLATICSVYADTAAFTTLPTIYTTFLGCGRFIILPTPLAGVNHHRWRLRWRTLFTPPYYHRTALSPLPHTARPLIRWCVARFRSVHTNPMNSRGGHFWDVPQVFRRTAPRFRFHLVLPQFLGGGLALFPIGRLRRRR